MEVHCRDETKVLAHLHTAATTGEAQVLTQLPNVRGELVKVVFVFWQSQQLLSQGRTAQAVTDPAEHGRVVLANLREVCQLNPRGIQSIGRIRVWRSLLSPIDGSGR